MKIIIRMQCACVCFVNLFPQLLNAFVRLLKLVPLYSRSQVGHLWMWFPFSTTQYSVVLNGKKRERKEARYDNSWFSVCEFTPVPPGSTGCLELHLPPKFMRLHPLSCLSGDRWFLSVSSSLPHAKPVKVHFTHFRVGGKIKHSELKWFVLELHKAVMEPRGKGISWLLPGSIVLSWIKPSRSLILAWVDHLPLRTWPVGEEFWNIKASHGGSGGNKELMIL